MAATLPQYVIRILDSIAKYSEIPEQCSPKADPLYQDWRFNIICDTLSAFHKRGISKRELRRWVRMIQAIYPWSEGYDVFRQNVNRRFTFFPWIIAMTTQESQVEDAFKIALKYNIPFCNLMIIVSLDDTIYNRSFSISHSYNRGLE